MSKVWYGVWPDGVPKNLDYGELPLPVYLQQRAAERPDQPAVIFYGRTITYSELDVNVNQLASALSTMGVQKGDRVGLYLENSPQFIIAFFAIMRCGAVIVTLNPMFKGQELSHELNDASVETLIVQDLLYPRLVGLKTPIKRTIITSLWDFLPATPELPLHQEMLTEKQTYPDTYEFLDLLYQENGPLPDFAWSIADDLALLQYTSGTTGMPKGAMITHRNIFANTKGGATWAGYGPEEIHLSVLPFFHVTGIIHSLCIPLFSGGTIVLLTRFDTATVIQAITKYHCNYWVGIATMNIAVVNHPGVHNYDLTSLKFCGSGGAPIPLEVLRKFKEMTGSDLIEGYGLSETISQVVQNPFDRPKNGSIGIPVIDVDIKIVDLANPLKEVVLGEEGELLVKGPQVTRGYWQQPEVSTITVTDGWLATGDIVKMDEEGYLYICGRKKELIKASGFSVFPSEVENLLYSHPAISETAVIGVPHPYRGEDIKAFIVIKPDFRGKITEQEIINWAKDNMAAYKYPRQVEFRDILPKTGSGKILRRILMEEVQTKCQPN